MDLEMAEWVRDDAKRMHRTLNGQIVYLMEQAREQIKEADPEDAA